MMTLLIVLATAAEAYLLGSIDTGILVSKYLYHDDVRNYGSNKIGQRLADAYACFAQGNLFII